MRPLPRIDVRPEPVSFIGGLDIASPQLRRAPGTLSECLNYESEIEGGYRRVLGYERFDGRTSPAAAIPLAVACVMTLTPVAGTLLTIGAVTGTYIQDITDGILLANVSGTVPGSTAITGTGAAGTTSTDPAITYSPTPAQLSQWYVDCADYYRTLVAAMPGSGPARGVWMYGGEVYGFRDNVGASACVMHKATTSGWTAVSLGEEIAFANANLSVGEGDVLTQGAVTSTIRRVVVETGSLLSGVNTGRLIISGRSGGNYTAAAATSTGAGAVTLSAAQTAITLAPGGRYRFRNWNFFGQASTRRMYGVSGTHRAFEFDGTTFVPISTGLSLALDTPAHLEINRGTLWLAVRSSALYCAPGTPYNFSALSFAGEIAVGADITALQALPGKALGIFTKDITFGVFGSSQEDFVMDNIAPESGTASGIVGALTSTFALDDRGVIDIKAAQEYGNFSFATASRKIQPLVADMRRLAVESVVIHSKDQWRILMSDGRSVSMIPRGRAGNEFMVQQYLFSPTVACCEENESGNERYFIGAADGFIYEMEKGSTFDGAAIEAYFRMNFFHAGTPRLDKTFLNALMDMSSGFYGNVAYTAEFSQAAYGVSSSGGTEDLISTGSLWDVSLWDVMVWDSPNLSTVRLKASGTGTSVSISFYSNTKLDPSHAVQEATFYHIRRKLNRGQ